MPAICSGNKINIKLKIIPTAKGSSESLSV